MEESTHSELISSSFSSLQDHEQKHNFAQHRELQKWIRPTLEHTSQTWNYS